MTATCRRRTWGWITTKYTL